MHAAWPLDHIPPQPDTGECCCALQLQGWGCKSPKVSAHVSLRKLNLRVLFFFLNIQLEIRNEGKNRNMFWKSYYVLMLSHAGFCKMIANFVIALRVLTWRLRQESCFSQLSCGITVNDVKHTTASPGAQSLFYIWANFFFLSPLFFFCYGSNCSWLSWKPNAKCMTHFHLFFISGSECGYGSELKGIIGQFILILYWTFSLFILSY